MTAVFSRITAVEPFVGDVLTDEHIAKFPPFKGPRIGGNFEVDDNVLAALPIPGTEVLHANTYGNSLWGRTAKIVCRAPDGKTVSYFHKSIKHEMSLHMIQADFESVKALHGVVPTFAPEPYGWGPYKSDPTCHFMLAEFREVGQQPPEPVRFTARLAQLHKESVSPTGKFGFHLKTMAGPIQQHNDGWSDSWEDIFSNFLGHLLDLDGEKNSLWPEFEHIKYLTKARVIPRLLRPLQSNGRTIKPCLVHGDLWDGNSATDMQTGEPFVFDPKSFYAHNEYETGNWRAPRHRLSSKMYVRQYQRNFPVSEPEEDWDARNLLYSLTYNTSAAILYPAMKQRDAIYEGMKDLCTRFCHEELLARLRGDSVIGQLEYKDPADDDFYGQEEMEEDE
ncbi:putative Ketosamine-3-kinase [Coniochaeta ligniaria NRRL 30616]|uniref:protein-ribulosamine 3-kinase n=1 Tax=Coniochaeta ligniaria NRRL 30616 TaxID=1408157 RepID=A0A1J7JQ43_9PEZI|nr:putative Ketosamine-3-kinase [Coniochaeta ligniaria NRRL 30616]